MIKELQEKIYHLEQQLLAVKAEKSYPSLEQRVSGEYVDELRKKIQFQVIFFIIFLAIDLGCIFTYGLEWTGTLVTNF